jgi:uncharacterized protein (TIGR02453 family)
MTAPGTTFAGFGDGAVEFYDGLLADNSRAYWADNKQIYERDVRDPMLALLASLEPEFGPGRIFRPHRDIRFSHDKSPYKTHCGGYAPPFYVQLSAEGLMAAAGYFRMSSDQLARFRAAVDDDRRGAELVRLLDALTAAGLSVEGEQLQSRPRGVDPGHPRLELMRRKGLYVLRRFPPDDVLHEPGCLDRVRRVWRAARPLVDWLADHVGPAENPRR